MPFEIVRGDVTAFTADAIVNAANPQPAVGGGVDAGIHQKAGAQLLSARRKLGPIPVGQAAVTGAYGLNARYVIHAVGPAWEGGDRGEEALLRSCYDSALTLAWEKGCRSVVFPLLSAGNYGFPKDKALGIAIAAFSGFLMDHDMRVILAVFDRESFVLSEKLFHEVRSYIDERYIEAKLREEYGPTGRPGDGGLLSARLGERRGSRRAVSAEGRPAPLAEASIRPLAAVPAPSLEEMLRAADAGFSETLLRLIDRTGKKDAEIYKRANIDRKLFSKIRSNPAYRPSKPTAVAFAIALELTLEETRDFVGRAGYALTHSSKFDIIVEYFILQKNYDIFQINETLFAFDQPLLGG